MAAFITTAIVGIVCIIIGISNMRGNISTLHSYHTHRVREEDKPKMGKLVGLGTIIIGVGVIAYSALSCITLYTESQVYTYVGIAVMVVSFAVGLWLTFLGMFKYNGGIF